MHGILKSIVQMSILDRDNKRNETRDDVSNNVFHVRVRGEALLACISLISKNMLKP